MANAFIRRALLLDTIGVKVVEFELLKELYQTNADFGHIWAECVQHRSKQDFFPQDSYLFKGSRLCIPDYSLRQAIIEEQYGGGLGRHLGHDKTVAMVAEKF